jgi:hypothetical protein
MIYSLVLDCAAEGISVAVTCRVLEFSTQAFYQWKKNPVSQRDWMTLISLTGPWIFTLWIRHSGTGLSLMLS